MIKEGCDTAAGWCKCGDYHLKAKTSADLKTIPSVLPCGCAIRNAHGAVIGGRFAPTRRLPDGSRKCRCRKRWRLEKRFVEIKA